MKWLTLGHITLGVFNSVFPSLLGPITLGCVNPGGPSVGGPSLFALKDLGLWFPLR